MERAKILVVDDESRMRKLVKDFLTREGYIVLEAGDGMEAMDLFYEDKDIALIILDVMMPKMDGWQVCREVRETSKVPIIMLTAAMFLTLPTAQRRAISTNILRLSNPLQMRFKKVWILFRFTRQRRLLP